jgi:hypothetical protein
MTTTTEFIGKGTCCGVERWRGMMLVGMWLLALMSWELAQANDLMAPSPIVLNELSFNGSSLSITSLRYNPSHITSEWVRKLLGDKAIFWTAEENDNDADQLDLKTLQTDKLFTAVQDKLTTKQRAAIAHSKCSVELLGFALLDEDKPFLVVNKNKKPSLGHATLTFHSSSSSNADHDISLDCVYRGVYDNWRNSEIPNNKPHFWPVMFFCPSSLHSSGSGIETRTEEQQREDHTCNSILHIHELISEPVVNATVIMQLKRLVWVSRFQTTQNPHLRGQTSTTTKLEHMQPAICTALPYSSTTKEKELAVGAILFEWVRYYSLLGFKVIIYDRNGHNHNALFSSKYANRPTISSQTIELMKQNLLYFNYTMLSTLANLNKYGKYDNSFGLSDEIFKFDDDHTLSLTHCRVDASARYGWNRMVVADFDEFLYCRAGGSDLKTQRHFVQNYLSLLHSQGYDQVGFMQRIVHNRTRDSPEDCVKRQAHGEANSSVFNCFGPYKEVIDEVLVKSFHNGLGCPLTTDHSACALSTREFRSYDCACTGTISSQCDFVHLSMNSPDYANVVAGKKVHLHPNELKKLVLARTLI